MEKGELEKIVGSSITFRGAAICAICRRRIILPDGVTVVEIPGVGRVVKGCCDETALKIYFGIRRIIDAQKRPK